MDYFRSKGKTLPKINKPPSGKEPTKGGTNLTLATEIDYWNIDFVPTQLAVLNRSLYSQSLKRVVTALKIGTAEEKGKSLEELVDCLFGCTKVFQVIHNIRTPTREIDRCITVKKIPCTFLQDWSTFVPIECKNRSKPMESRDVGWAIDNAKVMKSNICIIISSNGITGVAGRDARGTIHDIFTRDGISTIVLTLEDLIRINNGTNFLVVLYEKYLEAMLRS